MKLFTLIFCIFFAGIVADDRTIIGSVLRDMFWNSTAELCPTCGQKKFAIESILSESEIKKYRIEVIKKSILDSLGLNKPPTIKPNHWPQPFKTGSFFNDVYRTHEANNRNTIGRIILIPQGIKCAVEELGGIEELSIKMKYELPESIDPNDVISAKVWLDFAEEKEITFFEKEPKSFLMELIPCGNQTNEHITTFRGFQSFTGDWMEFDAMPVMKSWLDRKLRCFNISLTMMNGSHNYCKTTKMSEHKPFLTIHHKVDGEENQSRLKRSRNCTATSSECCRENLYVSFKDIGWSNFIISPRGYEAYYCRGSCTSSSSSTQSATPHNSALQALHLVGKDISSCCGPTKMSSMQLLVSYSNGSAKLITMENSVVEACGCM